uniref:Uncharacterized protein n=1 Tax=Kalanchoe fedtschenkoi TaxID=63787 RepID=A0A7N0TIH5_KALFE
MHPSLSWLKRFSSHGNWNFNLEDSKRRLIGWDTSLVSDVQIVNSTPQLMHCKVSNPGHTFTWSNKREGSGRVLSKIDRV